MKIRDLSPEQLKELLAVCAEAELKCESILDFEIEELPLYIQAAVEDRDARIERRRKWCALMDQFCRLIDPIRAQYPDLEHGKLIWFLHAGGEGCLNCAWNANIRRQTCAKRRWGAPAAQGSDDASHGICAAARYTRKRHAISP